MGEDDILFGGIECEIFPRVFKGQLWVRQSVEPFPGHSGMGVPVIEEHVMEHPGPCRGTVVQMETAAPFIIIKCNVQAVVVAVCPSVVRILLHPADGRMAKNIRYM